ncbi:MAG: IclR family transcriptional regulator [Chloroflexi bacterium]|nr:IclR family transcriptional regulator [Chloroflexota bacterium]
MLQIAQHATPAGQRVLDRVLDVLDALERDPEATVTELARRLNVDKSTASRQLAALAQRGYVDRDAVTGRFRLGIRLLHLGSLVARRLNIRTAALPVMTRLRDATNETICLSIRRGLQRVYIEVVESRHEVRRTQEIGVFRPLYPGAPGKAFLAFMPATEVELVLRSLGAVRFTSGATPDRRAVEADLAAIRASGASWSEQETIPGAAAAALPILDHSGEVVAVLSIAMPITRLTPEHRAHCIEQGRVAAAELSHSLGFLGPA